MFYFHTDKLRNFVPDRILSGISLWDDIVGWEQELMGIEEVWPSQMNNHVLPFHRSMVICGHQIIVWLLSILILIISY